MRGFCYIIICNFILLSSCNYKKIKDIDAYNVQRGGGVQKPISSDLRLGYSSVKEFVLNNCLNCHVGKTKPELSTLAMIQQNVQAILAEVRSNKMPPAKEGYDPLNACQKAMIEEWVKLGLPEDSNLKVVDINDCREVTPDKDKKTELPIEQMPINYSSLLERILKPRCIGCHNVDNETEAASTLFFPYEEIAKDRYNWKAPGTNSKIARLLRKTDDDRMPPPEEGAPLSESEIQFVIKWVDAGKPKD
jgi:hypothetical protein